MKSILKATAIIFACLLGLLVFIANDDQEVFIESQESKTALGGPVFNKIKLFQRGGKDIWMMNQSHHGSHAGEKAWDRLAIVVDKTQSPKIARFYQLASGPLEWREGLAEKPFKVSCFMCHNNGPRVIRPNDHSPLAPTSFKDRLRISYWNLRVKFYGRVMASPQHDERDQSQLPPFRFRSSYENELLQVAACSKCHKESGFLARGALSRQQVPTIKFMFESGQMPPLGLRMSAQEKQQLKLFLEGF